LVCFPFRPRRPFLGIEAHGVTAFARRLYALTNPYPSGIGQNQGDAPLCGGENTLAISHESDTVNNTRIQASTPPKGLKKRKTRSALKMPELSLDFCAVDMLELFLLRYRARATTGPIAALLGWR